MCNDGNSTKPGRRAMKGIDAAAHAAKRAVRAVQQHSTRHPRAQQRHAPVAQTDLEALPFQLNKVATVREGSLRNHAITYSYFCVGERIANHLGPENVNWCSFAAWASRTVGHVLNEDELPGRLAVFVARTPPIAKRPVLRCVSIARYAAFKRHRSALIAGNTAVFTDIAQRFVELIPFLSPKMDDVRFEAWLCGFRAPSDRPDLSAQIESLRDGFRLYRRAALIDTSRPGQQRVRAEMLFVAAAQVGAYEQLLLQPSIESALLLRPGTGSTSRGARRFAAHLLTDLMVVNTPVGMVRIGTPVQVNPWSTRSNPVVERSTPLTLHAEALYERFPLPAAGRVQNWADYEQRMGWIVEFFRWFSAHSTFADNPFDLADRRTKATMDRIIADAVTRFGTPDDLAAASLLDLTHAESMTDYVNRLSAGLVPLPMVSEADLDVASTKSDPLVDDLIQAISTQTNAVHPDELTKEVMRLAHSAQQSTSAIHSRVHSFLADGVLPPDWIDDAKVRRARTFFSDHALDITSVLFYCALPTCYACGDGAEVVRLTEELVSHTHRRTSETAQFIFDVMGYNRPNLHGADSFQPGTDVHHAVMGVRLLHGTVRSYARLRLVSATEPINQEEMLGTILAFSTVTLRGLHRIGISPTTEEAAAYWHIWAVVGAMLGIDEHLVNVSLDEAYRLTDRMADRLVRPSKAGAELAEALLADMHRSSVAIMGPLGHVVRFIHPALIRYMSRLDVSLALDLRPSFAARTVVRATPIFIAAGHRVRRNWSPMRRTANWWARQILKEYMTIDRGPNRTKFDFGLVAQEPRRITSVRSRKKT